jgi:predicted porin
MHADFKIHWSWSVIFVERADQRPNSGNETLASQHFGDYSMKKTQVALAALALVASTAAFADVKVYGTVDAGVATSSGKTEFFGAGNNGTTQFGITGSEDIGGGLKANFNLLSGINLAKGAMGDNGGGNTNLFNRGASVGVSNETFGLTIGNQFSNAVLAAGFATGGAAVGGDGINVPAAVRLFGGKAGVVAQTIGSTASTTAFFIPGALQASVNAAGISANVMHRLVDKDGSNSGYTAFTVSTAVSGVNLAAGYQQSDYVAANKANDYKTTFIAGNTMIGDVRLNAAFANNSGANKSNTYVLGASMPLMGALAGGLSYANGTDGQGTQMGVALEYGLSKQTAAYLNYLSFSKAGGGAAIANDGNLSITGKTLTTVGLKHSF